MILFRFVSRKALIVWLLVAAIIVSTPVGALGKIYRTDRSDGAEGDPGDGLDYIGGGGGDFIGDVSPLRRRHCGYILIPLNIGDSVYLIRVPVYESSITREEASKPGQFETGDSGRPQ